MVRDVHRLDGESSSHINDAVAVEEPLEIRVEGRPIAITMRTPGHDRELAAGFLLTEGVITSAADVFEINVCPATSGHTGNVVDVLLRRPESVDFDRLTRHVFSASSCGLCGKATLEAIGQNYPPITSRSVITLAALHHAAAALFDAQATFQTTGGLHAAALVYNDGTLAVVREDVGRHNAVDKVLGHALLDPTRATSTLLVSGRIAFEIMQKALAARIVLVAGVSAPTSLAVDFATTHGQTLVGFLRPGRANLYAGALD